MAGRSGAPELDFFALAGYDAITLGNHDFDASEAGLARMLQKVGFCLID